MIKPEILVASYLVSEPVVVELHGDGAALWHPDLPRADDLRVVVRRVVHAGQHAWNEQ